MVHRFCIKELKETKDLMVSADYKDRFAAELLQLQIRANKLEALLEKADTGHLHFIPDTPLDLLRVQLQCMKKYYAVLEARAIIEDIFIEREQDERDNCITCKDADTDY